MKKFLLALTLIIAMTVGASARDTYSHDGSVLPEAARTVLAGNFKKAKVSLVKIDKKFGRVDEYEVIMTDGSEVEFDAAGNWKNVETNKAVGVPSGFIIKPISSYVSKTHPGTKIVGIEKERHGYDVELSNGIEMKFDSAGAFLRYDD